MKKSYRIERTLHQSIPIGKDRVAGRCAGWQWEIEVEFALMMFQ